VSGYYAMTVRVVREGDWGTSTRHLPTFYLHENVQGIVSADHACRIAVAMFDDVLAPDDDAQVIADATYIG
jgi:hypothetical protein